MKQGKWNYTEDISYKVFIGELHNVPDKPMHWQNVFAGKQRQIVDIWYMHDGKEHHFYLDNEDGSGLLKIHRGGGPDSYSAHVDGFDFIRDIPESDWQLYDSAKHDEHRRTVDEWQKSNFPEEFERMESLRRSITKARSK